MKYQFTKYYSLLGSIKPLVHDTLLTIKENGNLGLYEVLSMISDLIDRKNVSQEVQYLQTLSKEIETNPNKIKFGNDVFESINMGVIETLYTLDDTIEEKIDTSSVKKIIHISGRTSDSYILKNCNGIIGILYYDEVDIDQYEEEE
jgi:peptide subunit release factor 1 (eRF1)